jgi:hypothetical protein
MSYKIEEIEGIGPSYAAKLAKAHYGNAMKYPVLFSDRFRPNSSSITSAKRCR